MSERAVDSRGVGLPDYSSAKPTGAVPVGPVYTSSDVGELAARLNSVNTFDRRGNVIWFDDFENGFIPNSKWTTFAGGVVQSTTRVNIGGFSARMTTAAVTDSIESISRNMAYPTLSNLGIEVCLSRMQAYTDWQIGLGIDAGQGTAYKAIVRWLDPATGSSTGTWQYYSSAGIWEYISDFAILTDVFHTIKLVADFENFQFLRLITNDVTNSLSNINLYSVASGLTSPYLFLEVAETTRWAFADVTYINHVIITQNEPPND